MAGIESKWRCDNCGLLHDDEYYARDCCPNEISEVFVCPLCSDTHCRDSEALECCGYDPDAGPPPPTPAQLEAMGQLRLIS